MSTRSLLARWFRSIRKPQAPQPAGPPARIESLESRQLLSAAPVNLVITPLNCCQIRLTWSDNVGDQAGFRVYRSSSATGTFTQIQELDSNTLTYTDAVAPSKTYYYRVTSFDGGESAPLSGHVTSMADPAGNSVATAKDLGTFTGRLGKRSFIGANNTVDFWKFTTTRATTVSITMDQLGDDLDVMLYRLNPNKTATHLATSENSGTTNEFIQQSVAAGTYLVKVYRGLSTSNGGYRLLIAVDTAGDTMQTARNLGILVPSTTINEFVGSYDQNDYFKFNLTSQKLVNLAMTGLSGDADMELLDANGTQIRVSENQGTANENILKRLNAGTYYIHIYSFQGAADTNYKLAITVT